MDKIPDEAESLTILVGGVKFLKEPVTAFVRLEQVNMCTCIHTHVLDLELHAHKLLSSLCLHAHTLTLSHHQTITPSNHHSITPSHYHYHIIKPSLHHTLTLSHYHSITHRVIFLAI